MIDVAAFITTVNFFACVERSATASASGVSTKPASTSTRSLTMSSCARRLAVSGTPAVSLRMSSIRLPGGIGELPGVGHDQSDLDGLLCVRRTAGNVEHREAEKRKDCLSHRLFLDCDHAHNRVSIPRWPAIGSAGCVTVLVFGCDQLRAPAPPRVACRG